MEDGRTVILFYREPRPLVNLNEAIEVVEDSQFALLLASTTERGAFEQKINAVQVDLDETYLPQTILAYENEFVILCQNTGSDKEEKSYLAHQLLKMPSQVQWQL
jgi:hypothetical protein